MTYADKFIAWLTVKKALLLITLFGLLAYGNILFNGFVWDDEQQIVNNTIIQKLTNFSQIFSGATFSTGGAGLSGWFFRPFLTFSYMLNYALWGANAYGFHLFQLVFHLLNGCLIFLILQKLLESRNKYSILAALIPSLIFIVHPAISEGVSYIAALSEVMLTFFDLLAFYLLIKTQLKNFSLKHALIISLFLFAGALYKESSIIIFPILISFLLIFKIKNWKWVFTLILTGASYLFLRLVIVKTPIRHPEFAPISDAKLQDRLLTIPSELTHYLSIIIFPDKLAISQHWVIKQANLLNFWLPLLVSLLFILGVVFLFIRFREKIILLGLIWFLLGFGLISNIFPLDMTIAERWLYFPIIGIIFIFAGIFNVLFTKLPKVLFTQILIITFFCLIVILSTRTVIRNNDWKDGLTLFSHDQKISQDSFDLENNLGVELFRTGKVEEAKPHFEKSIALSPNWYFAYNNLGAVYEKEKDYSKAEKMYQETLKKSDYFLAAENLTQLTLMHKDPKEAKKLAEDWLKKLPYNAKLWSLLAVADYQLKNKDLALKEAYTAYQILPSEENAYIFELIKQGKELNFNAQ